MVVAPMMVTIQDRMLRVPISASLVGMKMMAAPSMLSMTEAVSCTHVIFGFGPVAIFFI